MGTFVYIRKWQLKLLFCCAVFAVVSIAGGDADEVSGTLLSYWAFCRLMGFSCRAPGIKVASRWWGLPISYLCTTAVSMLTHLVCCRMSVCGTLSCQSNYALVYLMLIASWQCGSHRQSKLLLNIAELRVESLTGDERWRWGTLRTEVFILFVY